MGKISNRGLLGAMFTSLSTFPEFYSQNVKAAIRNFLLKALLDVCWSCHISFVDVARSSEFALLCQPEIKQVDYMFQTSNWDSPSSQAIVKLKYRAIIELDREFDV